MDSNGVGVGAVFEDYRAVSGAAGAEREARSASDGAGDVGVLLELDRAGWLDDVVARVIDLAAVDCASTNVVDGTAAKRVVSEVGRCRTSIINVDCIVGSRSAAISNVVTSNTVRGR